MKRHLQNLALLAASVLLAVVAGEIGFRATGFRPGNPFERLIDHRDEYLGYRMIPGAREEIEGPAGFYDVDIVTSGIADGRGFRDGGRAREPFSIFFGDSFVWGYGVELGDRVTERVEALTGKEVANFGMTAFTSPTQYARAFALYGPELGAEYAFFGVFWGNDLADGVHFDDWLSSGTESSYPEWQTLRIRGFESGSLGAAARRFVYEHSALCRYLLDRIDLGLGSRPGDRPDVVHVEAGGLDLVLDPRETSFGPEPPGEREAALLTRALEDIRRTGESASTQPVVVLIPTKEMVYRSYFPPGAIGDGEDVRYTTLIRILDASGLAYLDLLPVFRNAVERQSEQLYFGTDGHWNGAGHALAAARISEFIRIDRERQAERPRRE